MPVYNRIAAFSDDLTEWRRDLHAHPELGFQEHRTSDIVAQKLGQWGIDVTRGIAHTGVVGTLRCGSSPRAIGIRADMDALPIEEQTDLPYKSLYPGKMHACGHDGHTAMLLGAARYLAETRNFDGTVHFIFQPAEEGPGGGRVMVEEGLFDRFPCDMVFGAHNDFALPVGTLAAVPGSVNAAADEFTIHIHGVGGHAAGPQAAIDPIIVGAHIVLALQTVVARRVAPLDSAVLSICQFHAGTTDNVIPAAGFLNGTIRTLRAPVREEMQRLLIEIATTTARAHGAEATVDYQPGYPSVVNDRAAVDRAVLAAAHVLGDDKIIRDQPPRMGAEDFSYMAQAVPGCFVRLGQAGPDRGAVPVHHPRYDFNDDILPIGASVWAALVEQELARG
jgi:hippurate hydrolase